MLIVNADDFGASVSATDPAIDAFEAGLITSASAMVWMPDSARAAELASEHGLPLGLHLNLTLPYGDPDTPASISELQEELSDSFDSRSWHSRRRASKRLDAGIREAVNEQLRQFRELYGEPTHLDGHHHVHVHPSVLRWLPTELPIRPVLRRPAALGLPLDRRERMIHKRFVTADGCVPFTQVFSSFDTAGARALEFARAHTLEVMVHPQLEEERAALRSDDWARAVREAELGTYRDLPTGGP